MKVLLERNINLIGSEMSKAWTASIVNAEGQTVITASAVSAEGALRSIESQLTQALRAIQEMKKDKSQ
jgi:hypothetical protein